MANYINNKDFYAALKEYQGECRALTEQGLPTKVIPRYIGECFIKLAQNYSNKHRFRNYSYVEDMEAAAIEICMKKVMVFDAEKYSNPFAYFTTCVHNAFLDVMARERKQQEVRRKAFLLSEFDTFNTNEFDDEMQVGVTDYLLNMGPDANYVPMDKKKEKVVVKSGLELFADDAVEDSVE